ncbi:NAD(P)-dependent oxidoreductase [Leifsonia shinshuensis]|nr:NAD(P)-dependent oxidoreductase [Leifsonia shinshuensis]
MGLPIAGHLVSAGHDVTLFNRTRSVAESVTGATVVGSPADLAAEVVFSALPDIDQFDALVDDATLHRWRASGTRTLVVLSTTSPEKVRTLEARAARAGIDVADAPMSGGDAGARAGTLSLMVGASDETFELLLPLLRGFATTIEHFGPPGAGSAAKLCNQLVVAGTLAALAESVDLGRRAGLSVEQLMTVFHGGLASSRVLDLKEDKLLHREYSLGGSTVNQLKDLDYAVRLAEEVGAPLAHTRAARELYRRAERSGYGQADHSAVQEVVGP